MWPTDLSNTRTTGGAAIHLGVRGGSQVRRSSEANLNLRGQGWKDWFVRARRHPGSPPTSSYSSISAIRLADSERSSGRRKLDRQIESYLADVERSLLHASVHESQLEEGLVTRTTIGQAVGLLMAQEGLTSEEAFTKLVHVSQNANIKLRDIAQRYVDAWEERAKRNSG